MERKKIGSYGITSHNGIRFDNNTTYDISNMLDLSIVKFPKLGDIICKPISIGDAVVEAPGVVTYIHKEHFWYQLTFQKGYKQCYKLPEGDFVYFMITNDGSKVRNFNIV